MHAKRREQSPEDLFRSRLDQMLDPKHPLVRLANAIDWEYFEREFGSLYVENVGRPGKPIRILVGLHYLKHAYDESDESCVERFIENPYWQYFCGFEYFQHEFPLDPTTLVKWRQRVGEAGSKRDEEAEAVPGKDHPRTAAESRRIGGTRSIALSKRETIGPAEA